MTVFLKPLFLRAEVITTANSEPHQSPKKPGQRPIAALRSDLKVFLFVSEEQLHLKSVIWQKTKQAALLTTSLTAVYRLANQQTTWEAAENQNHFSNHHQHRHRQEEDCTTCILFDRNNIAEYSSFSCLIIRKATEESYLCKLKMGLESLPVASISTNCKDLSKDTYLKWLYVYPVASRGCLYCVLGLLQIQLKSTETPDWGCVRNHYL